MKIFLLLALLAAPLAFAEETQTASPAKKVCPLCKLPGRAALFAGAAKACPAGCARLCCTGTMVTYRVEGLVCDRCSAKLTRALAALEGVLVESVTLQSGHAVMKYDPAKVKPARLIDTIVAAGFEVTAELASFKLTGLTDAKAVEAVEKALAAADGISNIETVCHKTGTAVVLFDPAKTTREKIAAAINTTRCKVAKDG